MGKGAIWIGVALIIFGIWLMFKVVSSETPFFILIYPALAIVLGILLIVFYREEDKIEERKDLKG